MPPLPYLGSQICALSTSETAKIRQTRGFLRVIDNEDNRLLGRRLRRGQQSYSDVINALRA